MAAPLLGDQSRFYQRPSLVESKHSIVFVHGAWHGGWCWQRITSGLSARGCRIFTPTLTGLGERAHLASPQVSLDTHIQDIVNVIKSEELSDVILVGHSYGGMVITGVADTLPDSMKKLIYLDAFVPHNGNAMIDLLPLQKKDAFVTQGEATGYLNPLPPSVFGISNTDDMRWVTRRMVPQPYATFSQPIRLSNASDQSLTRSYIYCANPPSGSFTQFAERFKKDPTWNYDELDTGHDCMITSPAELVRILLKHL